MQTKKKPSTKPKEPGGHSRRSVPEILVGVVPTRGPLYCTGAGMYACDIDGHGLWIDHGTAKRRKIVGERRAVVSLSVVCFAAIQTNGKWNVEPIVMSRYEGRLLKASQAFPDGFRFTTSSCTCFFEGA